MGFRIDLKLHQKEGVMMDFIEAVESRISRRGFAEKNEKTTLEKILRTANRCPSYMNTQPWEVLW